MAMKLTDGLRQEYDGLFSTCATRASRRTQIERVIDSLVGNRGRYERVSAQTGVPWYFIAVTHNLEASQNFSKHLHNGDPLTARTRQVPAGRPKTGTPPFTWEESAVDALRLKRLQLWTDWSVAGLLFQLETYNGWGYRNHGINSPYLWSFSQHYTSGKYVSDGVWSATAVSAQCGAAVVLHRMRERGIASIGSPLPEPEPTGYSLLIGGKEILKMPLIEGRSYCPVRRWANAMGFKSVDFNNETKIVTLEGYMFAMPATLIDDSAYLPIRDLATAAGLKLTVDDAARTVSVVRA
jgi:lysozyme family protein